MNNKYNIAGYNIIFKFHHQDFFNQRLKEYESDFADDKVELTIISQVNNQIREEDGRIVLVNNNIKQIIDDKGNTHLITYKGQSTLIAQKMTFDKEYRVCYLEMIDHPNKFLTLEEREYVYTCQAFVCLVARHDGAMIHASAIAYKGKGIFFSANSGTGKSTHTQLWTQLYGDDVKYINDDKPVVRIINHQPFAYGTPWSGKTDFNHNICVPLKALVMLQRGEQNVIKQVPLSSVLHILFPNINVMKYDEESAKRVLQVYNDVLSQIDIYHLYCTISLEAPKVVKELIFGNE